MINLTNSKDSVTSLPMFRVNTNPQTISMAPARTTRASARNDPGYTHCSLTPERKPRGKKRRKSFFNLTGQGNVMLCKIEVIAIVLVTKISEDKFIASYFSSISQSLNMTVCVGREI